MIKEIKDFSLIRTFFVTGKLLHPVASADYPLRKRVRSAPETGQNCAFWPKCAPDNQLLIASKSPVASPAPATKKEPGTEVPGFFNFSPLKACFYKDSEIKKAE